MRSEERRARSAEEGKLRKRGRAKLKKRNDGTGFGSPGLFKLFPDRAGKADFETREICRAGNRLKL
jgi:hypothetical protein